MAHDLASIKKHDLNFKLSNSISSDVIKDYSNGNLLRQQSNLLKVIVTNKKELIIWGDGTPKREVIYVDDIADACLHFMNKKFKETIVNIGTGKDLSIKQYAKIILDEIIPGKNINIKYDKSKPNGTPRKVLDISLAKKYGWKSKIDLKVNLNHTCALIPLWLALFGLLFGLN